MKKNPRNFQFLPRQNTSASLYPPHASPHQPHAVQKNSSSSPTSRPAPVHATNNYPMYTPVPSANDHEGNIGERIDRYSITRRPAETRDGRGEFKPLWKSSQKLISPFSVRFSLCQRSTALSILRFIFEALAVVHRTQTRGGCKFIDELATAISPASIRLFH